MVVDYSKWDKLELSDDSDVEVHPNVDKRSFIRWKQRDIHEKREQAKFRIAQLEVNLETNADLLKRVDELIAAGTSGKRKIGIDIEGDVALSAQVDDKEKPALATSPQQPKYNDMIESMLSQIVAENGNPDVVLGKLKEHREMIIGAMRDEGAEKERLEAERKQHITTEDIKTGWDSTIVYHPDGSTTGGAAPKTQSTGPSVKSSGDKSGSGSKSSIEVLNSPGTQRRKPRMNEDGLEELLPETAEFGEIPKGDMEAAYKYLLQHPWIVTEGQKDALTMSAFDHELAGDTKMTEQVVWNALLIQYSAVLGRDGVRMFFSKVMDRSHPAAKAFADDVQKTYTHIRTRCRILKEEAEADGAGEESIQLHPVDPDTELVVGIPEEGTEGWEIYNSFKPELKEAIATRQLAQINEVLASMKIEEAEDVVAKLGDSGVLQVESKIYDQGEWDEKRAELEAQMSEQDRERLAHHEHEAPTFNQDMPTVDEEPLSTVDDVD